MAGPEARRAPKKRAEIRAAVSWGARRPVMIDGALLSLAMLAAAYIVPIYAAAKIFNLMMRTREIWRDIKRGGDHGKEQRESIQETTSAGA